MRKARMSCQLSKVYDGEVQIHPGFAELYCSVQYNTGVIYCSVQYTNTGGWGLLPILLARSIPMFHHQISHGNDFWEIKKK